MAEKNKAKLVWKKCDKSLLSEKQRLKVEYNNKNKISMSVVAQAKAIAFDKFYNDLETREGQARIYKLAAQRRNNAKEILAPKFIEDEQGRLLTQDSVITKGWKNYFEKLLNEKYPRNPTPVIQPIEVQNIEDILIEEIEAAVCQMKNGKAVGPDEIPVGLWKICGTNGTKFLGILFNKIKQEKLMPQAFRESLLIPFYKGKGDSRKCVNYRGIKLIPHTLKLWERVIVNRRLSILTNAVSSRESQQPMPFRL